MQRSEQQPVWLLELQQEWEQQKALTLSPPELEQRQLGLQARPSVPGPRVRQLQCHPGRPRR